MSANYVAEKKSSSGQEESPCLAFFPRSLADRPPIDNKNVFALLGQQKSRRSSVYVCVEKNLTIFYRTIFLPTCFHSFVFSLQSYRGISNEIKYKLNRFVKLNHVVINNG